LDDDDDDVGGASVKVKAVLIIGVVRAVMNVTRKNNWVVLVLGILIL
jgi:hypothetical protein